MGKYNFNYERVQNLEKENAELRQRLEALEKLMGNQVRRREVISQLDRDKVQSIFGIEIDNGKLKQTAQGKKINEYFSTFYSNVARLLIPKVYIPPHSTSNKYKLAAIPCEELNDEEFAVVVETMQSIVDILDYAKKKLNRSDNEAFLIEEAFKNAKKKL